MNRRFPWSAHVVAVVLTVGCAAPQPVAAPPAQSAGPDRDAVCERFVAAIGRLGSTRFSQTNGHVTSPPQAAQHLDGVETLRDFGRWARAAQDPAQAGMAARIEQEAERVTAELSPDHPDRTAQRLTRALYRATAELYYDCQRELYQELLRNGGVEMTGACAEPGAPKLDGPNVMVYGSSGRLTDTTCELVQGDRVGNGCGYSNQVESAPGDGPGPWGSEEVAYDPDTCRALFEHGRAEPGG